jgi:hypothetical protein
LDIAGRPAALTLTLGRNIAMIGVFVTLRYGDNFDEQAVRKIAETARASFEGMPGLRSKAFTEKFASFREFQQIRQPDGS